MTLEFVKTHTVPSAPNTWPMPNSSIQKANYGGFFFPFLTTFSSPLITREPPTTKWTLLLATHGFLLPFLRVVTLWSNLTSLCMEKIPGAVGKVLNLRAIWGLVQQTLQYLARRSRLTPCEFVIRAKR